MPESQILRVSQDKRNCGVSKNVVYGFNYKCTVLSPLDQNIGLNKHKLSLLVNNNAAECNVFQEKWNYHETIHDDPTGIKETI